MTSEAGKGVLSDVVSMVASVVRTPMTTSYIDMGLQSSVHLVGHALNGLLYYIGLSFVAILNVCGVRLMADPAWLGFIMLCVTGFACRFKPWRWREPARKLLVKDLVDEENEEPSVVKEKKG